MPEHVTEPQADLPDTRFTDQRAFRAELVRMLRRQVFGPSEGDESEELSEVLSVSPLQLYATGVLFPQRLAQNLLEEGSEPTGGSEMESVDGDLESIEIKHGIKETSSYIRDRGDIAMDTEPLNLANEFSPSACGISFRLDGPGSLVARITYGTYLSTKAEEPHPRAGQMSVDGKIFPQTREIPAYKRNHHAHILSIEIGGKLGTLPFLLIDPEDAGIGLSVTVRGRRDGGFVVSCMVVNRRIASKAEICKNEDAYMQVALEVREVDGRAVFLPIDRDEGAAPNDEELTSLELLYSHRRAFALGHGVAGDWNRSESHSVSGRTDLVSSAALPTYEVKPILPREQGVAREDLQLSMSYLYDAGGLDHPEPAILAALKDLAADYGQWIENTALQGEVVEPVLRNAVKNNLRRCRDCLERILIGIEILANDPRAMLAFRLMNRAMLIQQYHSSVVRFRSVDSPFPQFPDDYKNLPSERKWRPFQLAFILMNIAGMSSHASPERSLVDLIWFPTGGGKTEAYLGLSAFTICIERLLGEVPSVTVLMRYTLRLLTAQQFQRAAALVLALEVLRQDSPLNANLGEREISIGLWVGNSLSPNKRSEARNALVKLEQQRHAQNPFQVLKCPWCGVDFTSKPLGYRSTKIRGTADRTVRFVCPDDACRFGSRSEGLPILVIDEDIYDTPPTILIGTVDKFAQVAWDQRVGRLFGIGLDAPPPALVIQDELHLISGPLGTIVGLYETVIDRMCSRDGRVHKVVASTATIRRAHQQCKDLYARDAFVFPPQGIRAGDSYFAREDDDKPGRLYVGFMGSAVKSHQTALVRACSPLLQGVCVQTADDEEAKRAIIDPYGTMVWYFNSLRELGHAATLCMGDIPEFLKGLRHRLKIPYAHSRYLREIVELTSRSDAEEIPAILQQLEIPWKMNPAGQPPVDILLATNMIAVGVDVSRLGLIVMSGQPKGTSEYIQATSRVGRAHPGLALTVYTQTKSRDRSHYERFVAYHQSLYRQVEPTSVTPFSPQARDRGMRGVLIALARQMTGVDVPRDLTTHEEDIQIEIEAILKRVATVDEGEKQEAEEELVAWLAFWKKYMPAEFGPMAGRVEDSTLIYAFGGVPDPIYQREAWPVMTSMRNVDGTCTAQVINVYEATTDSEGDS